MDGNGGKMIFIQATGIKSFTPITSFTFMSAAGMWFGLHAFQNLRSNTVESQRYLWRYLVVCGFAGILYGIYGIVGIISRDPRVGAFKILMLLGIIFSLSFGIREIYYTSAYHSTDGGTVTSRRRGEKILIFLVVVAGIGTLISADRKTVIALEVVGVFFSIYGINLGRKSSLARGTAIDTVLRNLLPVLACAGMIAALDILVFVTSELEVQPSFLSGEETEHFLIVIVASFLLMSTIRLQQNLE